MNTHTSAETAIRAQPREANPEKTANCSHVEWFQFMAWRWDVTAAIQLAAGRVPSRRIDVRDWAGMLKLIVIEEGYAARMDLSQPLIVVPVPNNGGPLIIDGWHRLYKALSTGVESLSGVMLTAEEELACRIYGGQKGQGYIR